MCIAECFRSKYIVCLPAPCADHQNFETVRQTRRPLVEVVVVVVSNARDFFDEKTDFGMK